MIAALKVFWRSVGDTWFNLIGFGASNLVTAVLSILILPGPPMLFGLVRLAGETSVYRERPEVGELLRYAREHAVGAWKLAIAQVVLSLVIFLSFFFYLTARTTWSAPLALITGSVAWTWLGVLLYSIPLYLRSERGVAVALRNGLVAMLHYPFFSSTLIALLLIVFAVSVFIAPLLVLVTLSFYAVLANRATDWVLQREGLMPIPEPIVEEVQG